MILGWLGWKSPLALLVMELFSFSPSLLVQADMQYEDQRKKEAEAMRYWEEKKIEEQVSNAESDMLYW